MHIADLHIHSRYSRATSRDCTPEYLDLWARRKGISILGTGDFTHPAWREELEEKLEPAEDGLYVLKSAYCLTDKTVSSRQRPRFVISGEISSIYKKNGRVRKVHSLILLPSLKAAQALSLRLEAIGNIHSDGRPILGLDCRDLLEITLEACPEAVYIPAHIWTPHFSLFGAFSGFDTIEECFEDLTPHIHALETGLSSDPPMNWRLSALDSYQLVSNSDAHSPAKLGREANLLDNPLSYQGLSQAVQTGEGLLGTLEFFPEEGKYHFDGHRKCHLCLNPVQAEQYNGICPVCGRKLTTGVLHRVEQLADRGEDFVLPGGKPFESLVPLPEVIAACTGRSAASSKVQDQYLHMLSHLGPEFEILRSIPIEDIQAAAGTLTAEGIRRLRSGLVRRRPGYDGEYGTIQLLEQEDIDALEGQISFFSLTGCGGLSDAHAPVPVLQPQLPAVPQQAGNLSTGQQPRAVPTVRDSASGISHGLQAATPSLGTDAPSLNEKQQEAVTTPGKALAVIAGPGTGKTKTLVSRILYLLKERKVKPSEITAVTFTNKAAREMRERLEAAMGSERSRLRQMNIGTFHSLCQKLLLKQLPAFTLADQYEAMETAQDTIELFGLKLSPKQFLQQVSLLKTDLAVSTDALPQEAFADYKGRMEALGILDFDDLLLETLNLLETEAKEEIRGQNFHYLLVDEFQDINPVQYRLINAWFRGGRELFVIGDPDQSIYGFRGSDSLCFQKLAQDYPELKTIALEQNYRSTPEIIHSAVSCIQRNPGLHPALLPNKSSLTPVHLVTAPSPLSEGIFIAREINRLIGGIDMLDSESQQLSDNGPKSFSEIAILYRTHRQGELLEKCLQKEGIPYIMAGREDFLDEDRVRGVLGFFRFLQNTDDLLSLRLCLRYLWDMPRSAAKEITCQQALTVFKEDSVPASLFPERFCLLCRQYLPKCRRTKPQKLLDSFLSDLELAQDPSLVKLSQMTLFYKTMKEFLDALTFGVEIDLQRAPQKSYTSDAVTLMTLHGSKGLEFPVVFLAGAKKGTLPLETFAGPADTFEERRLFYVGLTRAKDTLYLLTGEEPSPFLSELPQETLHCQAAGRELKENAQARGTQMSLFDFL